MSTKLGKEIDAVMNTKVGKTIPKSKWCSPTGTKVMDIFHGISLLAVLAAALYNMVMTIQGNATIITMRPIFVATLVAAIIKIPSQVCSAHGRLGGWMTVLGSVFTVVITSIMVGYMYFDPKYQEDRMEDVCIVEPQTGKTWNTRLETMNLNTKGDPALCNGKTGLGGELTSQPPQRGGPLSQKSLYRAGFNPGHWSPVFQA